MKSETKCDILSVAVAGMVFNFAAPGFGNVLPAKCHDVRSDWVVSNLFYFFAWANNYTKQNNYTLCYK